MVALVGLVTLVFLIQQTEATRQQAEEAASQVTASRLDGIYEQLLTWDQFWSSTENKRLNLLARQADDYDEIKDPEEREQLYSTNVWFLDYFDYVYTTLPGLLRGCVPEDGHLVLRGSPEESQVCDEWVAWSQTIYNAFIYDKPLCQTLNDAPEIYERKFVGAIRDSRACRPNAGRSSGSMH
ncbi:hypothetical protein ACFWZY_17100 [Streptomyces sp. NPDC058992]|uniref:hypothetical protein n=1 Tax=Streptomyces sp. NPDC058992 TaxID=3346688 RepID=UPI003682AEFA